MHDWKDDDPNLMSIKSVVENDEDPTFTGITDSSTRPLSIPIHGDNLSTKRDSLPGQNTDSFPSQRDSFPKWDEYLPGQWSRQVVEQRNSSPRQPADGLISTQSNSFSKWNNKYKRPLGENSPMSELLHNQSSPLNSPSPHDLPLSSPKGENVATRRFHNYDILPESGSPVDLPTTPTIPLSPPPNNEDTVSPLPGDLPGDSRGSNRSSYIVQDPMVSSPRSHSPLVTPTSDKNSVISEPRNEKPKFRDIPLVKKNCI